MCCFLRNAWVMARGHSTGDKPGKGYRRVFPVDRERYDARRKGQVEQWTVVDDLPAWIPVTKAEIDLFEAYFGDVFDEVFGASD